MEIVNAATGEPLRFTERQQEEMAADITIRVKHIQRGQENNYEAHRYRSEIVVEGKHCYDRLLEPQARELVKAVVHGFTEEPSDGSMSDHFQPRLRSLEMVEEQLTDDKLGPIRQVWSVEVSEPYCD